MKKAIFTNTCQALIVLTCLALFACEELFNYRLELRAEVVAVEPAFKENLGALRDKIPAISKYDDSNGKLSCPPFQFQNKPEPVGLVLQAVSLHHQTNRVRTSVWRVGDPGKDFKVPDTLPTPF